MNEELIYKFGNFTFRVKEYNLKMGDKELYLRPKTYKTLLQLIEHHGAIVKKDDLIENVWSGTIVTENTLTQCIKEIREKLGDNSANPRFVKTIPRVGYKFIAPVMELKIPQNLPIEKSKLYKTGGFRFNKANISIIFLTALIAAAIIFFIRNNESKLNFSERDWVLITNFNNQTGNEVFESALRTALEMELSNSKYVNVVSQGRTLDILNLMRQNPNVIVNRKLGREICLRDGNIQIMISGSIYKIGYNYSLSLAIINPLNNVIIKSYTQKVNNQQEVLPAIGKLAIYIRKELGESLTNFPKVQASFEKVTTTSLKALNFYSKGVHYLNLFDIDRAEYFLNQAVQYDSTFAMGYSILGFVDLWQSNLPKGKSDFEKAAKLAINLSDREKYFILGSNAMYVNGDYKKSIEYYELLLDAHPDDYWGNENLSIAYLENGNIERYLKFKNICEKLRPKYFINHSDRGLFSLYYDRNIEKANKEFNLALELKPDFPFEFPHLTGAFLEWMNEDIDSAQKKISGFLSLKVDKLIPMGQITSRWSISHFFLFQGKFNETINILNESIAISQKYSESNLLRWSQKELALVYLNIGRTQKFEKLIRKVINNSSGILRVQALGWLAINCVKRRKIDEAQELLIELQNENRLVPVGIMQLTLPKEIEKAKTAFTYQIKAEIYLVKMEYDKAKDYLNKVIELVPSSQLPMLTAQNPRIRWTALRLLAHIYEDMGNWDSAIAAYQKIINEKILVITVPAASNIWVKTLLSISKAFEKQGNYTQAKIYKKKYEHLLVSGQ